MNRKRKKKVEKHWRQRSKLKIKHFFNNKIILIIKDGNKYKSGIKLI